MAKGEKKKKAHTHTQKKTKTVILILVHNRPEKDMFTVLAWILLSRYWIIVIIIFKAV